MSSTTRFAAVPPPAIPGLDLQEKVGDGGMSFVYRAVHRNLQRTVAVKVLRATADEGAAGPGWLRESRLMAALAHPHVVAIHDAGAVEGHNYLVMEYMAGGSLRTRMTPGRPWPLAKAAILLDGIARALEHIHKQRVLHLDLKPENILYTADGQIKITDFGISTPHADANALLGGRRFQGTLDYCAPEYRSGLALDGRYDVFSLATLAYELLTGRVPGRVYVPASRRNPRVPRALDDVLRRGLARDPNERYASVSEFRQALENSCRPSRSSLRRKAVGLVAVAAALLAMVLVAVAKWGRDVPSPASAPDPAVPAEAHVELPDHLFVLYDKPDDLALFTGNDGGEIANGSAVTVERAPLAKPPRLLPIELAGPARLSHRPVLIIQSAQAYGFVHPLQDRSLAQRAVTQWPNLLREVVPPEKNLVKAGGFDGDCLAKNFGRNTWRVGSNKDWNDARHVSLDASENESGNSALLMTNLDPEMAKNRLRCFQPIDASPPAGAILVLRYRARSLNGQGRLSVHASIPVKISRDDATPLAGRVRAHSVPLPAGTGGASGTNWLYWSPNWVTPTREWRKYIVIFEAPPFPNQTQNRSLNIDVVVDNPLATDQVWVDDVELFVWQPGSKP